MKNVFELINEVLIEWDPIGVGKSIAANEYQGYIPLINKKLGDKDELKSCLENILVNELGLSYDSNNETHVKDLDFFCDKFLNIEKKLKAR